MFNVILFSPSRLLCALCRQESKLQHMRVLCYDIIRSLYARPGTVLYLMISIAAVWPSVLASSPSTTSTGLVCLSGESYQPLPCTIQMILTTWARSNDWVLLGNVLDWLCAWKQVPTGVTSLQQLAEELVQVMKDPSSAQLTRGKGKEGDKNANETASALMDGSKAAFIIYGKGGGVVNLLKDNQSVDPPLKFSRNSHSPSPGRVKILASAPLPQFSATNFRVPPLMLKNFPIHTTFYLPPPLSHL